MEEKMNKTVILYQSKYGASKRYALMIQKEIPSDVFDIRQFAFENIHSYDLVLAIGGIYAGGIAVMKHIRKHLSDLNNKTVLLLAVGASPYDRKAFEQLQKRLPDNMALFYARGAYDEKKMDLKDRTLCRLLKKSLQKKAPNQLEPWMQAMLEADENGCDWVEKSQIETLLAFLQNQISSASSF